MKESERLAQHGLMILAQAGWPEEKAHELMDLFMRAGMHYFTELQVDEAKRNEVLIQKALIH